MILSPLPVHRASTRGRSSSVVIHRIPAQYSRVLPLSVASPRSRRRTIATFTPPRPPRVSPFARLPLELVWAALLAASLSSTSEAKQVALVCKYARRLALPALFATRALRAVCSVHDFFVHARTASPLTPIGALTTSLWLTATQSWPPEAARAVVRECPNLERLALTNILALAPWVVAADTGPLFAVVPAGQKLELTLVGHNTAEDVYTFVRNDPASAAAMGRRLATLRVLKPRSAFPSRFHERTDSALPGTAITTDEGVVDAMLTFCLNVERVAVPYVPVTVPNSALEACLEKEIDLIEDWIEETGINPKISIELLASAAELESMARPGESGAKGRRFANDVQGVDWPRNVDAARERWMLEP
jgi:hypothetical protein